MSEPRIMPRDAFELGHAIKQLSDAANTIPQLAMRVVEAGEVDNQQWLSDVVESYLNARQRIEEISTRIAASLPEPARAWHEIVQAKSDG